MEPIENIACGCEARTQSAREGGLPLWAGLILAPLAAGLWWLVYTHLKPAADYITFRLLPLAPGSHLGEAIAFFLYDTPKVMMLLVLVVFGVGVIRSYFSPERTRALLVGKSLLAGNVLAALLGVVTPFCSCSAVPLFIGFVTAGVPLGVTFSFLIAAPMVNEIALGLLYGLVGWKVAALYAATGLSIAVAAGWTIGRLRMEGHIEDWVSQMNAAGGEAVDEKMTWPERIRYGWAAVVEILGRVWKYILIGIALGALIHGFVPEAFMARIMGSGTWWSVPLAVVLGVPMYSNAAGIIPVVEALLGKGAALGSTLAFMMSVIALSLPEMVILRKVLKPRLIATFIVVVAVGILVVGYLFNAVWG
ncbi:MAG: permease [Desulfobacterales bacterium]|nr:permease [Desulfobacterales bacterium]